MGPGVPIVGNRGKENCVSFYVKMPEMWRQVLAARPATVADYKIALELLTLAKFSPVVKFTNERAAKLGISRQTKWRSLNRLANWGLISWQQLRPGASPVIRVKWLAGRQPKTFHQ